MDYFVEASDILEELKIEYIINRISQSMEKGSPVNTEASFSTYMTVTNAKKEELTAMGLGDSLGSMVKVRILKSEFNQIEEGDKFTFEGDTYEITRPRPYQSGMTDFRIFYAGMEIR